MSDTPQEPVKDAEWRSKKYLKLSDEEIIELSLKQLNDKDRLYLKKELDYRNLGERAERAKLDAVKKVMRSKQWWKYIPLLFALFFLIKRMMGP
ncbi:MAG: hypothetical protein WC997_10655 [Porticoccaceae bacterium]